jgi:hypothetical protein
MKRIRILGLCLVAVFAMTAIATSSASALTYKTCKKDVKNAVTKKYEGQFINKNCSTHATPTQEAEGKLNKYSLGEWNEGKEAHPKFKDANGVSVLKLYIPGVGVVGATTCAKAKGEGHIDSSTTGDTVVVFEKCTSEGFVCTSPGETAGKIKTSDLTTRLAEDSAHEVIQRVGEEGVLSAEFNCGSKNIKTTGVADGVNTGNVNTIVKESKNTFTTETGGEQAHDVDGDVLITEGAS